jgi:soluble lytic murein transglycosylase
MVLDTLIALGCRLFCLERGRKRFVFSAAVLGVLLTQSLAHAGALSENDKAIYRQAFSLIDGEQWPSAIREADRARDPVLRDVILWKYMQQPGSGYSFGAITGFITTHPHWPYLDTLRRRAVDAIDGEDPAKLVAWFKANPPFSGEGKMRYAEALMAQGEKSKAITVIREAWATETFNSSDESRFLNQFGSYLTAKDHIARLDDLLWQGHHVSSERMLSMVDAGHQALARARIALQQRKGDGNRLLSKVPKTLLSDPGLIYDRIVWRMKKDLDDDAADLLKTVSADPAHADIWWRVRQPLARYLLRKGHISDAYKIASRHGMTEGSEFVEAEWLAGWISLRHLNDAKTAQKHFDRLTGAVFTPISLARAAYWQGRAAEAMGQKDKARAAYAAAAVHVTTFYGQLAAEQLPAANRPPMPQTPQVTAADKKAFAENDLVKAVRALSEVGQDDEARRFLYRLTEDAPSDGQRVLAVSLGAEIGRREMAVAMSRRAAMQGTHVIESAYPTPAGLTSPTGKPETAVVLSIIRQESNFDSSAISHAGARGLMQLMPATARHLAKKWKLNSSVDALTADPKHNIRLGSGYLEETIDRFNGSYIMAVAGYNAGPGRPARWAVEYGDPRRSVHEAIDWIEMIPFNETRNYVQRVMESVAIYRARLSKGSINYTLGKDLLR